ANSERRARGRQEVHDGRATAPIRDERRAVACDIGDGALWPRVRLHLEVPSDYQCADVGIRARGSPTASVVGGLRGGDCWAPGRVGRKTTDDRRPTTDD